MNKKLGLLPLLLIQAACAAATARPWYDAPEDIDIVTNPPGATIIVNGDTLAASPVTARHTRGGFLGAPREIAIRAIAISPEQCSKLLRVKTTEITPDTVRFDLTDRPVITDFTRVFEEEELDEPPALTSQVQLDYPDVLRRQGIQGKVVYRVVIDSTGHPVRDLLEVVEVTDQGFLKSARDGILALTYRPGYVRGHAVSTRVTVPITYSIRGAGPGDPTRNCGWLGTFNNPAGQTTTNQCDP